MTATNHEQQKLSPASFNTAYFCSALYNALLHL